MFFVSLLLYVLGFVISQFHCRLTKIGKSFEWVAKEGEFFGSFVAVKEGQPMDSWFE